MCSTTRSGCGLLRPTTGGATDPDMDPVFTSGFRASIVARARFIEDLVAAEAVRGVAQYVLLGAGLDTFAQRRPEIASRLQVFEVDRPGPQAWKRRRLVELGFGVPEWLRLVPVDFETTSWWEGLAAAGFDPGQPAVVASTGVSMYLTREANAATLGQIASFAPGSTLAMTFLLPLDLLEEKDRPGLEMARARRSSLRNAVPAASSLPLTCSHSPAPPAFARPSTCRSPNWPTGTSPSRSDGFRPSSGEDLLVATT